MPNPGHTKHSDKVLIETKLFIRMTAIKYVCPECDSEDEVVIHSPFSSTTDLVTSVEMKLEHLWERHCYKCNSRARTGATLKPSGMEIKGVSCTCRLI